jgi:hypothetical protein
MIRDHSGGGTLRTIFEEQQSHHQQRICGIGSPARLKGEEQEQGRDEDEMLLNGLNRLSSDIARDPALLNDLLLQMQQRGELERESKQKEQLQWVKRSALVRHLDQLIAPDPWMEL